MSQFLEVERKFVLNAWSCLRRPDKRLFQQLRDVSIEFPSEADRGVCLVRLGGTVVNATVVVELVEPATVGGKLGFVEFRVHHALRDRQEARADLLETKRLLAALIKGAQVLDPAALCVVPGKAVWSIAIDVMILNDEGNATDAALWASIGALQHARRPEISVMGETVVVHPPSERDPIPLALHHYPISITAAITPRGDDFVIDPTVAELAAAGGTVLVALNYELQVCDVHKEGVVPIDYSLIKRCIAAARSLVPQLAQLMQDALARDEVRRKALLREQFEWAKTRTGVLAAA